MKKAAEQEFNELNDMYRIALEQIQSDEHRAGEAMKALAWLTFSKRVMTSIELCQVLAIDPSSTELDEDRMPNIVAVIRICRGLIHVDNRKNHRYSHVRLAHQTVEEYLKTLPQIKIHLELICVTCFTSLTLRRSIRSISGRSQHRTLSFKVGHGGAAADDDLETDEDFLRDLDDPDDEKQSHWVPDIESEDYFESPTSDVPMNSQLDMFSPGPSDKWVKFDDDSDTDSDNGNAGDDNDDDDLNDQTLMKVPFRLDKWAQQKTSIAKYAGVFAKAHLDDLEDPPEPVVQAIWQVLTERSSRQLWQRLLKGRNDYISKCTPLHAAVIIGHGPTIERLLDCGIDVNILDVNNDTPLIYAVRHQSIAAAEILLNRHADNSITNLRNRIALEEMTADMPKPILQGLVPNGYVFSITFLNAAARAGTQNLTEVMMDHNHAPLNLQDASGRGPLGWTCEAGHLEIAKLLHGHDADIHQIDGEGDNYQWTPLHFAARYGHFDLVKYLVEAGADPHCVNKSLETPLMEAVEGREANREKDIYHIVHFLLKHKASVHLKNIWGGNALRIAASSRRIPSTVKLLIEAGSDIHDISNGSTPFQNALQVMPDSETFKILLDAEKKLGSKLQDPSSILFPDDGGNTPLHLAAKSAYAPTLAEILGLPGVQIDARNHSGETPLHCAMHPRGAPAVDALIKVGASIHLLDYNGKSLLDAALPVAPSTVIELLVQRSCRANLPWPPDSSAVKRFEAESWFPRLKDLCTVAKLDDGLTYTSHIHEVREDAIYTIEQFNHQPYLSITIPDQENYKVQRMVFQTVSHDQGKSRALSRWNFRQFADDTDFPPRVLRRRGRTLRHL